MIALAFRLALADLRRAPGRAAAVAGLLVVAALLPAVVRPGSLAGAVLAVVVASAATAGAAAQHERRARILTESGAETGAQALVTVAGLVGPGTAAAAVATVVGLATGGDPSPAAALAIGFVVPVVAGAVTTWVAAGRAPRRRGTVALAVLAVLTAPLVVVPLALVAVLVVPPLTRARRSVRIAVSIVAVAVSVAAAVLLSWAETFWELGALLLAAAVPLTVAVGWLGGAAVAVAAAVATRLGPTARLATAPLGRRRRQLGPIAAVVAVVATLAAAEGVVGASFEAREDRRPPPLVLGPAGTDDQQAIAVTTGLDPAEERWRVAEAVGEAPVEVAVIDRIDGGGTGASPTEGPVDVPLLDLGSSLGPEPDVSVATDRGPVWVGVVAPEALGPLGLDAHAAALAAGDALVLDPGTVVEDGRVEVAGAPAGPTSLPAVVVGDEVALLLPAVLVSDARAAELGGVRNGARAVVVPRPGAAAGEAVAAAERIRSPLTDVSRAIERAGDVLEPGSDVVAAIEQQRPVAGGAESVQADDIAPLDDVPLLARTTDAGQQRAIALGGLAVLVALAGTLLVVGGARSEDAVLVVQGAPDRHRVATAAVQTTTVALAGTVLGAIVGLGVPALAFALYNGRERDARTLDVPYVLPPGLVVLLVAVPLAAAALAAIVVAARGRPSPRLLAEAARG